MGESKHMPGPVDALKMLMACIESSAAVEYGQTDVLRSEDRENWADAIDAARAAIKAATGGAE